jgi:hypothetical protein
MRGFRHWRWHHATLHNHVNAERHLVDRQTFKLHCSAALAEWQSFAASPWLLPSFVRQLETSCGWTDSTQRCHGGGRHPVLLIRR